MNFTSQIITLLPTISGLIGALIGGLLASLPLWIQEKNKHKRWLIEHQIEYLKQQINEIDKTEESFLKYLHKSMKGEKFDSEPGANSVPMEVIEAFRKHLPNGRTYPSSLTELKKQEIWADVATAFEKKKQELNKNIKKLLT